MEGLQVADACLGQGGEASSRGGLCGLAQQRQAMGGLMGTDKVMAGRGLGDWRSGGCFFRLLLRHQNRVSESCVFIKRGGGWGLQGASHRKR